ncbi:putative ribonuclease H-like domain-containing protein [Tanacetum coccineum]
MVIHGTSVSKMSVLVTAEEKTNKKNNVKARSLLLMAPPNEHQLTSRQYNDAKTMFAAIKIQFGDFRRFFKIVEQNVKKSVGASSGSQNLAFMTALSTSSTNNVNTAKPAYEVSTVSPNVNTASFSDNTVYAFMVEKPNGSNLLHQDLEKIHEDDLEAMDFEVAALYVVMRATKCTKEQSRVSLEIKKPTRKESGTMKTLLQGNVGLRWFRYLTGVRWQKKEQGKPQQDDTGFIGSGCSRHNTGNIAFLFFISDSKNFIGGFVTFGGGAHGGRISEHVPKESLTCLVAKATLDESMLWHRRLGHINFKNINKLVKDNLEEQALLDETSEILKNFIKEIENLVDKKVKIIRSDNGTEFKNKIMDDFCREKGIKREYSVARTPQQNGVAERRNRTLIEAARTMLADSKLPTTFWAEAVSTACYVQNRVLVVKPHNKTPYELFKGFKPALSFMKPFGCHVTILNTLDSLGKFDGKSDEGFFVGYSLSSKAFRVYNTRTRKVEENLHIGFLENKPMIERNGPKWLFDIYSLTQSMNYVPVTVGTISNESAGTQGEFNAGTSEEISQDCIMMPIWKDTSYFDSPSKDVDNDEPKSAADDQKQDGNGPDNENAEQYKSDDGSSPKDVDAAGQHVNTASPKVNTADPSVNTASSNDPNRPKYMFTLGASHSLEATHVEFFSDEGEPEVDLGNIPNSYPVPTTSHTRIPKDHPIMNVIGDVKSSVQTRRMTQNTNEQGFISAVYEGKTHEDLHTCLFACFLSQEEPKRISKALSHRAIGTKWIFRNKKDERGIVIRNKARLVAQGNTQEEGIDYDEVFAPIARIKAIRLFLAYASFMGFMVYQMDVKSAFLYGQIEEEVYVCQPPGFEDPDYPDKVYKVVKALYGLHQALRAW